MSNAPLVTLPPSIASPQDVTSLILEIRTYTAWFAGETIKQRVGVTRPADQPELSPATRELLRAYASTQTISRASLDALIASLESYVASAPVMTITLAAPAPHAIKTELTTWARHNIDESILLNFRFNRTLLGGMIVRYGSHIYDWSFRTRLMSNRHTLPEILNRV